MPSRRNLVEQFSTFLQFEGDRPRPWLTEPRLRQSMERCLKAHSSQQEANFWALFWHKQWLEQQPANACTPPTARPNPTQQLPQNHLAAFAQDGCYWAAQKTVTRFKNLPYGLSDCFQLAIAQFNKILRGFDSAYGSDFTTYANATFSSLIRETLRQRNEVDICTDWGLLRKLSKKRLTEALLLQGQGEKTTQSYVLAWQGFKLHYVPHQATGTRKLTKPDRETLEKIAAYYKSNKRDQLSPNHPEASPSDIEAWLMAAAQAARKYLYPSQVSVNAQRAGQETEFIDSLPETNELSPMDSLVEEESQTERQQQRQALGEVLAKLLADLDDDAQTLLGFYYRDGMTQQEMAKALDVKQYTVSRKLSRIRQNMVKKLATWSQEQFAEQISATDVDNLHTGPDLDLLNTISSVLDEWLQQHFSANASESDE